MKAVGIKILKNSLSKYLQFVQRGETVYVTDRDEIIAEIRQPTRGIVGQISKWEAFLNEMSQQGKVKRASRAKSTISKAFRSGEFQSYSLDLQRELDAIRGDRFK